MIDEEVCFSCARDAADQGAVGKSTSKPQSQWKNNKHQRLLCVRYGYYAMQRIWRP